MADPDCIFCKIIARRAPAHILDENDAVIVFLSLENHPLVVPKAHIPDIYTLPEDSGAAIMAEAVKVARAVKEALHCDGVYLTQSNEPAAGQDVFHFHLHVYPVWGDQVNRAIAAFVETVSGQLDTTEAGRAAMAATLWGALARL
jgi:histidine triad (HIT) family protein